MNEGTVIEVCVFPVNAQTKRLLMCRRTAGPNTGKWVPAGTQVGPHVSARATALDSCRRLGLPSGYELEFRGVSTEIGDRGDWRIYLFLYTASTDDPIPGLGDNLRWFSMGEIEDLPRPQTDPFFTPLVIAAEVDVVETVHYFDRGGMLLRSEDFSRWTETRLR